MSTYPAWNYNTHAGALVWRWPTPGVTGREARLIGQVRREQAYTTERRSEAGYALSAVLAYASGLFEVEGERR